MTRTMVLHYLRGMTTDVLEEFYPKDGLTIRVSLNEEGGYMITRSVADKKSTVRMAHSLIEAADIVVWMSL